MVLLKRKTLSDGFPIDKQKHMRSYEEFIESIRISFNFRINKESKKPEYRDLNGPEKMETLSECKYPFPSPSVQSKQRYTSHLPKREHISSIFFTI